MSKTIELGEHTYNVGKLDVMRQWHVARRLGPAVWALTRSAGQVMREALPEDVAPSLDGVVKALKGLGDGALMGLVVNAAEPLVDVFAHMSDADSEYVINACLSVCERKVGDSGWAPAYVEGSGLAFHDMTLPEMLQLVLAAVQHNVGNFSPAPAIPQS